jgi:hypothetical protein
VGATTAQRILDKQLADVPSVAPVPAILASNAKT